jgi:hypothetical protein
VCRDESEVVKDIGIGDRNIFIQDFAGVHPDPDGGKGPEAIG